MRSDQPKSSQSSMGISRTNNRDGTAMDLISLVSSRVVSEESTACRCTNGQEDGVGRERKGRMLEDQQSAMPWSCTVSPPRFGVQNTKEEGDSVG